MFSSYTAILHDVVEKNVTVLAHQVNAVHCRRWRLTETILSGIVNSVSDSLCCKLN